MDNNVALGKAGWRFAEYAELVGMSRSFLYQLPPDLQPYSVKLGAARVIRERPADYLERISTALANKAAA